MATLAQWSFSRLFWNEKAGCLYDLIDESGTPDASIRPNQIFAVSLPHTMLPDDKARSVVAKVQEFLLTPYGLRSLAAGDPAYHGRYSGDQRSRDGAYHQGTVWGWLFGPFLTAYLKVHKNSPAALDQAIEWLARMRDHLSDAGLGHISEIFEGDAPHRPVGCIAQAWSVAEILRAYVEDVRGLSPQAATNKRQANVRDTVDEKVST
jgi:glycogen debranching enzyme